MSAKASSSAAGTREKSVPVKNAKWRLPDAHASGPGLAPRASAPEVDRKNRVYLETYGCQMNEYDSGVVLSLLGEQGYVPVEKPDDAGVIFLNTCAIRENAHQKVYGRLQSFTGLKKRHPETVIGVLGCMAQNLGDDLFAQGLPVDMIVGPDSYRGLPERIREIRESGAGKVQSTRLSIRETYEDIEPVVVHGQLAFVTIMRGCDNFCTFCVVPYTRGRERSRSPESVVKEVNRLVREHGVKDITLLGQNVNSYRAPVAEDAEGEAGSGRSARRGDESAFDFADLVERILTETDVERVRFTSPHPHDFPERLLELMAREERFCSSIHLPVQSGSTPVLENMKRDYTRESFLELVNRIREIVGPDVGLTTDVIVGFPGETEEQFQETLSLMETVGFDMAYMFRYSEREGTQAKKTLTDDVPEEVKLARLQKLIELQRELNLKRNTERVGSVHRVLVEGPSKRSDAEYMGRSLTGNVVIFPVPEEFASNPAELVGRTVDVKITSATSATLKGDVV